MRGDKMTLQEKYDVAVNALQNIRESATCPLLVTFRQKAIQESDKNKQVMFSVMVVGAIHVFVIKRQKVTNEK
jgi:hypothetical protein